MKKCKTCNIKKEIKNFEKDSRNKNGITPHCKICSNKRLKKYSRTKQGVITSMYRSQKASSRDRNHPQPNYSNIELSNWLLNDWMFLLIYNNWKNCGYQQKMIPSIDRLDNNKSYTFDNIQIITWAENSQNAHNDVKNNKLKRSAYYKNNVPERKRKKRPLKISLEDSSEICEAYSTKLFTYQELANIFNVKKETIGHMIRTSKL